MSLVNFLFSPKGRIGRMEYFLYAVAASTFIYLPLILWPRHAHIKWLVLAICITAWPSIMVQIKRWHDRDKSGWWILINSIPYIGPLWSFIELFFLPGTSHTNRFDDDYRESKPTVSYRPTQHETQWGAQYRGHVCTPVRTGSNRFF